MCGRPLIIDGQTLVAGLTESSAWSRGARHAHDLAAVEDAALAAAWRADALDEHASVASFHQFGLELLAVGAPADLVLAAAQAAADEVGHVQACLRIAAALDGGTAGPGKLHLAGMRIRSDLAQVAVAAVVEGCIGETLAACQVAVAARAAGDPDVADALQQIAADEARHAELGWRFVKWAVDTGGGDVRVQVSAAFAAAISAGPPGDPRHATLAGVARLQQRWWGRVPAADSLRIARYTLDHVIGPCAAALLAASDPAGVRAAPTLPAADQGAA